jgi:hypothetical protein
MFGRGLNHPVVKNAQINHRTVSNNQTGRGHPAETIASSKRRLSHRPPLPNKTRLKPIAALAMPPPNNLKPMRNETQPNSAPDRNRNNAIAKQ